MAHHDILLQRKIRSRSVKPGHGLRGAVISVSWDQSFFDPIELPDSRELMTLRDAATVPTSGPQAGRDNSLLQPSISTSDRSAAHRTARTLAT
jgi:hypothetical protein